MLVLDASVLLEVLLATTLGKRSAEHLFQSNEEFHAPHLLDIEFVQVLRKLAFKKSISPADAKQLLEEFQNFPITRHSHFEYQARIWELRNSVSAYDGAYVALAEGLEAPLMTCDAKLSRSHGHRAQVVLLR